MKVYDVVKKCKTGIEGLDDVLQGGIPEGRVVLLAGDCGTGKTIFGSRFLYAGALEFDEPGIYVSLEQNPFNLKKDMYSLGIDLGKLEDEGKLIIIDASLSSMNFSPERPEFSLGAHEFSLETIIDLISIAAERIGAKRAVVDSFSALDSLIETKKTRIGIETKNDVRRTILGINYKLQSMGLTSLLISDIVDEKISKYGVEEFMVDGVITLHYQNTGADRGRYLTVKKMRSTGHSENIHPIEFCMGSGVRVMEV